MDFCKTTQEFKNTFADALVVLLRLLSEHSCRIAFIVKNGISNYTKEGRCRKEVLLCLGRRTLLFDTDLSIMCPIESVYVEQT